MQFAIDYTQLPPHRIGACTGHPVSIEKHLEILDAQYVIELEIQVTNPLLSQIVSGLYVYFIGSFAYKFVVL